MASFIGAADVIAVAVEIEARGRAFYLDLSKRATHPDDKAFFTFLAEEETRHQALFSQMLLRIGGTPFPAGATDAEYLIYVQDLINSHTLFMDNQKASALESPFTLALQFEKDTLLYFMAIEKLVPESEKHLVAACADEERKHLRLLAAKVHG